MKHQGEQADVFEREARILNEWLHAVEDEPEDFRDPDYNMTREDWVHKLADDFGIGHAEIWDMLPEYAA